MMHTNELLDVSRLSPAEFFLLKDRMVRDARVARAAAIGGAIVQVMAVGLRWTRLLSLVLSDALSWHGAPARKAAERTAPPTIRSHEKRRHGHRHLKGMTMLITIMKTEFFNSGSLASRIFRALRAAWTAQWLRRRERQAAATLHALSDYALRDLGIGRCQIDEQVRFPGKRYLRPGTPTELI